MPASYRDRGQKESGCGATGREWEPAGILPVRCPSQDTSVHEEVQDGLAGPRVRGEPLLRIWQRQTQSRRVKKGLLERDDEILNLAAVIGNHLFHPQSLKRRGLTTAPSANPVPDSAQEVPISRQHSDVVPPHRSPLRRNSQGPLAANASALAQACHRTPECRAATSSTVVQRRQTITGSPRQHDGRRRRGSRLPAPTLADTSFTARIDEHSRPLELT